MEPSTLVPPDGLSEGYGLRDDALDQLLMTSSYREVTLHYRPTIKAIQDAFCSDTRLRIISLPFDEDQDPPWPHMAWIPLWSNHDTCVLVADPLEPPCRHNHDYLLPLGFAQHYAFTRANYPYYLPQITPEMFWPKYLNCQPIYLVNSQPLSPGISQNPADPSSTLFSFMLETLLRIRTHIADYHLIEHGYSLGVVYNHLTLLYELPLPHYPDVADAPWLLSFLLIDAARAITTLRMTDFLTWNGLKHLIDKTRNRLTEVDQFLGMKTQNFVDKFDELQRCFTLLHPSNLRDSTNANQFTNNLLHRAGIFLYET